MRGDSFRRSTNPRDSGRLSTTAAPLPRNASSPTLQHDTGAPSGLTSPSTPSSAWLKWAVPAMILALATALRLDGIGKSLWLDEVSSYLQANAHDFMAAARNYDHPPLYFALLRTGLRMTGSFTVLRLFSVARA